MRNLLPLACLAVAALAGCAGSPGETPAPEPAAADGGATTERFFAAQLAGPVAIETRFELSGDTECSIAGFAHHDLEIHYDPEYVWQLIRLGDEGPENVLGSGYFVPYPAGRVHVAGIDSRPTTHPLYAAVLDTYWSVAFGERSDFTSWSGYSDYPLEAGTYILTAWSTVATVADGNELVGNASLATGLDCKDPFAVLSESYATNPVLLNPHNVQGETDISVEMAAAEVHQGTLQFTATGNDTLFWTGAGRVLGSVGLDGPVSEEFSLDSLESGHGQGDVPEYWRWLPAGDYTVSWDFQGVELPYWLLAIASQQPAPASWGKDSWERPY